MIIAFDMTPALLSPAGIGRYAREVERALSRRSDVELIHMAASRRHARSTAARVALGLQRELAYYPVALGRRARRAGADLLHCPSQAGPVRARLPLVMTVHDLLPLRFPELFTSVNTTHMRVMARAVLPRADRIIVGSRYTRGELSALVGVPDERIEVVPYGIGPQFGLQAPDREWLKRRFRLGGRYIVCVGTLEPRKNLVSALRAFRRLSPTHEDLQVAVVGGQGWRNERFEHEVLSTPGRVVRTGHVSDEELARLYSGAECLVFPSLAEGFGFPVLEAMASGTPVVSSNRSSLPEVVGDAGLLVEPDEDEAIAAAIERILGDPELAGDLRARGLRQARHFSWEACAEGTVGVYRRALS